MHDVTGAEKGFVKFCPRALLNVKLERMISIARQVGSGRGTAAKLYSMANFTQTGMYARIGKAGFSGIKLRRAEDIMRSQTLLKPLSVRWKGSSHLDRAEGTSYAGPLSVE